MHAKRVLYRGKKQPPASRPYLGESLDDFQNQRWRFEGFGGDFKGGFQ